MTFFRFSKILLMSEIFSDFIWASKRLHLHKENNKLLPHLLISAHLSYLRCAHVLSLPSC